MGHHRTSQPDDEYDEIGDLLAILVGAGASDTMMTGQPEWAEIE